MEYLYNNPNKIDEKSLIDCNFDTRLLLSKGYTISALKDADFDAESLRIAGITAIQLRVAGFRIDQMRDGGFTANDVIAAGYNLKRLRQGGFTAYEIHHNQTENDVNVKLEDLKLAGFGAMDVRACGIYTAKDLRDSGYTAFELKNAGFTAGELFRGGYTKEHLKPIGFYQHDGTWQNYNCYWSCCHSTDKNSVFCQTI